MDWTARARDCFPPTSLYRLCAGSPTIESVIEKIAALAVEAYQAGRDEHYQRFSGTPIMERAVKVARLCTEGGAAQFAIRDGVLAAHAVGVAEERARWSKYHGTELCVCEACIALRTGRGK